MFHIELNILKRLKKKPLFLGWRQWPNSNYFTKVIVMYILNFRLIAIVSGCNWVKTNDICIHNNSYKEHSKYIDKKL